MRARPQHWHRFNGTRDQLTSAVEAFSARLWAEREEARQRFSVQPLPFEHSLVIKVFPDGDRQPKGFGELHATDAANGLDLTLWATDELSPVLVQTLDLLEGELKRLGFIGTSVDDEQMNYLEQKILEAVQVLRREGEPTGDEYVAARLPTNSRGRPYRREWINKKRNAMRRRGLDV